MTSNFVNNFIVPEKTLLSNNISPHDLRRTFAMHLIENGIDIEFFTVRDLMDHAGISTTKGYDKRKDKVKKDAVKALKF